MRLQETHPEPDSVPEAGVPGPGADGPGPPRAQHQCLLEILKIPAGLNGELIIANSFQNSANRKEALVLLKL